MNSPFTDEELQWMAAGGPPRPDIELSERITALTREVLHLRQWIREEADHSNVCVYNVLREVCSGCKCHRKAAMREEK